MKTPKESIQNTPRSIINETSLGKEYMLEIHKAMKLYAKEAIHSLMKEYYQANMNVLGTGNRMTSIDTIALEFIKENL